MNLDLRLLRQLRRTRATFCMTVVFSFLAAILAILQARGLSQVLGRVFLGGQALPEVMPILMILILVIILRAGMTLGSEVSAKYIAIRIQSGLRELLVHRIVELGPAFSESQQTGALITAAIQGIESLEAYFSQYLPQLLMAGLLPLTILAFVFPVDLLSAFIMLLTAPLIPIFMILIGKAAEVLTKKQWKALNRLSVHFLETLQGLTTLKVLSQSKSHGEKIAEASERYRQATINILRVTFLSALVLEMLATISTALIAVQIGLRLLYGGLNFEEAFFILVIAPEFYQPLRLLGQRFHAGMTGSTAAQQIFSILEQPTSNFSQESIDFIEPDQFKKNLNESFRLTFDEIQYTYPGRQEPALTNVSFTVNAGQQVALVGPSGAGKTTLARLVLRFIQPQKGGFYLNERDIQNIPIDLWRSQVAWVHQNPHLFFGTVADNIRLGKPDASLDEVRQAATLAFLDDFIISLPGGYETQVGERGLRLSRGQAQRVALARAFLLDAPLVVMDEPTAFLDPDLERLLYQTVRRLCQGRTILMIAHRLPTVVRADRILVFNKGCLVEEGTHKNLIASSGLYSHLVQAYTGDE